MWCAGLIPKVSLSLWKNCLPWKQSLVPKRLGTAVNHSIPSVLDTPATNLLFHIGSFQSSFHICISLSYQVVVSVQGDVEVSRGESPRSWIGWLWIHTRKVSNGREVFITEKVTYSSNTEHCIQILWIKNEHPGREVPRLSEVYKVTLLYLS